MSNLLTLSQDEIDRFNLKGKQPGDVITAEEYSKHQKAYLDSQEKQEKQETAEPDKKSSKK